MAKRKIYTAKFMNNACKLVTDNGMTVAKAAKKVKINHTMLRKWINKSNDRSTSTKAEEVKSSTLADELQAKIQELHDQIVILERAADILR